MMWSQQQFSFHYCTAFLRARHLGSTFHRADEAVSARIKGLLQDAQQIQSEDGNQEKQNGSPNVTEGAMSRRPSILADESMLEVSGSSRKIMWEASFFGDLKKMSVPNLSRTLERRKKANASTV
ncbi:hypothetical protein I7I48_11215 [Histoplasma ohiense]|nr:hypothetical protein I7I48_11215 [Histoplasma ohiense (nom. inval.)]